MSMLLLQFEVDWANRTSIHPVGLAFTVVLAFCALLLPRRWAPMTLLALACFIPAGQRWVVLTLDFSFLRIMVLVGWLRVLLRREYAGLRLHALDLDLLAWAAFGLAAYSLRRGTGEALIFVLGVTFDAVGLYFLFRCLVRRWVDMDRLALALALLAVPVCLTFLVERLTGRNVLAVFGGVAEITEAREGRLRCQGAFGHPILAGCFWAAVWPLVAARWWSKEEHGRLWAAVGSACALTIIILTASSTPIMAAAFAALGGCSFLLRRFMRVGRIVLLVSVVGLHLVMNAPVWHLVARFNVVGGSTGWHRFYLIDETIKHFGEWWLLGTPSTAHWGRGLADLTNQYAVEAVHGGLFGLLLFLGLIVLGFRAVGRAWRAAWPDRAAVALAWGLGVSLFTQCVAFFGVSNFDQTGILWFLVLACLAGMSSLASTAADEPAGAEPGAPQRSRPSRSLGQGSAAHPRALPPLPRRLDT